MRGHALARFTHGKSFADYSGDAMLRAAVERQLEITGEALAQMVKRDAVLAARIGGYRRIIGLRNILIHGYADVDDALVRDVVASHLRALRREIDTVLDAPE